MTLNEVVMEALKPGLAEQSAAAAFASAALRALAEAGPTDGMVRAAAEEIEQGVKDYAVSDMDGGGFVTIEQAVEIARAAIAAALKEMGAG